ncbi:MAG TPA: M23 family metallopeptidase [Thermoleophilaceae bacterium]|jgi:murein DD-endopeptidase MepM/ murein hydrolase activator NlpD
MTAASESRARLAVAAVLAVGAATAGTAARDTRGADAPRARPAAASATAYARADSKGRHRQVSVTGDGSRSGRGVAASASTQGGHGSARASARVRDVNLFDGLVRASVVRVSATAGRGASRGGRISRLEVAGKDRGSPTRRHSYDLDGRGRAVVLAAGRHGIAGIRAHLTRAYGDAPAGTTVTVAFATATARDAVRPPRPKERGRDRSGKRRRRGPRTAAGRLRRIATRGGFAFPVQGHHRFADDYGAARQNTGHHEGNDVFAPAGTPVVAVTDGTLYRVGTRPVPGNRLWLRSRRGDTYFYAHLSSFAGDARDGLRVKAGQVLGFVGSTGDAEPTPPHVHFEVHPGGAGPANPYPFLRAWEKRRDVPPAAWLSRYARDPGARPGTLVVVRDYLAD